MSRNLTGRLFEQLDAFELVDPHTHIPPLAPAARNLGDILGYHYFTELAHSAGLPRASIEAPGVSPREKVRRLVEWLPALDNTPPYAWLLEMARAFWDFGEPRITRDNWEALYDRAEQAMSAPDWPATVLRQSRLRAVFLTNDFDDPLEGFDTAVYVPCLRTDDLVFRLGKPEVRTRLASCSRTDLTSLDDVRRAIGQRFAHFTGRGARACAVSLPPDFAPQRVDEAAAAVAWHHCIEHGGAASADEQRSLAGWVFWTLAEMCDAYRLPFDLMIGVNRAVYAAGVFQGQDLFDSRVSLVQYREVLNAFPRVTFPISVLASSTNQELMAFAWIFPNVVTHGHWWYSNTPSYIAADLAARLDGVPRTKQIGYYSDMYKLEFALPKFAMYKRVLARLLGEKFVVDRGWSEEQALALGRELLIDNVRRVFGDPSSGARR